MDDFIAKLEHLFLAVPYFVVLVLSLLLGKVSYVRTTSYTFDAELTERDNPAFGVHFALYLLGLMIAIGPSRQRSQDTDALGLSIAVGFAVLCIVLLRLSILINDHFLLREFSIYKEMVTDRNVGTGFVVGGSCVATGLIINGTMSVQAPSDDLAEWLGRSLLGVLVLYIVGQALLLVGAWVFRWIAGFNVHHTIEHDDNLAAGLAYGGFLVALGIVLRAALMGAGPDLFAEIVITLVYALIGLILLTVTRILIDWVLLPSSPLDKEIAKDRNPAAGSVAAASFICVALAFSYAIVP